MCVHAGTEVGSQIGVSDHPRKHSKERRGIRDSRRPKAPELARPLPVLCPLHFVHPAFKVGGVPWSLPGTACCGRVWLSSWP